MGQGIHFATTLTLVFHQIKLVCGWHPQKTAFIQKDRGTNLTTSGSKRLPPHAAPKMQFEMSPALELVLRWACFRSPPDKCLPAAKHAKTLKLHRFTPVRQAKSHGWPPVLLSDSA